MKKYPKSKTKSKTFSRITLIQVLFLVLALLIIGRLFHLQVLKHNFYEALAEKRHFDLEELKPERGSIYVLGDNGEETQHTSSLQIIATNQKRYLLYAIPSLIENPTSTIEMIEKVLPMTDEERWQTFLKLDKNDPYEPIRHYLTQDEKEKLEKLEIETIGFQQESKRIYPQNNLFSHILGFIGFEDDRRVGQYGIEEYFEKELAGKGIITKIEKDAKGRLIIFDQNNQNQIGQVENGMDLVLTVNPTIQFEVCSILEKWREKMLADDGTVIVLNPENGHILAMCNKPDFDLNNYSQVNNINVYLNKAVSEAYEPGSVFKAITMAAGLDLEKITPETTYEDKGFVQFGPDVIHNAANKVYGQKTMTQVLESSINTGAVFTAFETGKENFKKYVKDFGFGQKTGVELPAESPGDISNLDKKRDIYTATASYGQGIMVTPVQLVMAFGAIANGGILMKAQIVLEKHSPNGEIEKYSSNQEIRRVISSKTANVLKAMLVSVVKNGHGYHAKVNGYYVAGKTGTANIADSQGGYLENQTNHTFIGFAPVDEPKFVILVKLSKPKNVPFAEDSAAPAFAEIAKFLLQYYGVRPDYK